MVATEVIVVAFEDVLRVVTRRTTRVMQIVTGSIIWVISRPRVEIRVLGVGFWDILVKNRI